MMEITKYGKLNRYAAAFISGKINLMLIESSGGLGKTSTVTKALGQKNHKYLSGHCTPLALYEELFNNRDKLIVLDDIDALFSSPVSVSILKALCDTKPVKTLQYHTTREISVPHEFKTTSKVIILANRIKDTNEDEKAFLTRGIHIYFAPTPQETYEKLLEWGKDKEILKYLKDRLFAMTHLDMRKYVLGSEVKEAGLDWKDYLDQELNIDPDIEIAREITETIEKGKVLAYKDRVKIFKKKTGKGRKTYDKAVKKIGKNLGGK